LISLVPCAFMHIMNWDDLRYILEVSRGRTLSTAALALGVTHTTVSRRLRACEQQLGARLFERMADGMYPTAAGEELVQIAKSFEDKVLAAEGRVLGRDIELSGRLRVSTLDILFAIGRDAFASFVERFPRIELTVTTPMEAVSLTHREADVALRMSSSPHEGLVGRKLGKLAFAVFASAALVNRIGEDAGYADFPWIGIDEQMDSRWLSAWLKTNAAGASIVVRADENAMLMRQMLLTGVGVFFLPVWEGEALGLQRVGPLLTDIPTDVWLLTHQDLRHAGRVRVFIDHMVAALPPLLAQAR
jgi:DNA-binding transcriptional LysR family regulator